MDIYKNGNDAAKKSVDWIRQIKDDVKYFISVSIINSSNI